MEYNYPRDEHLPTPVTPFEKLEDELRLFGEDESSFTTSLTGLHELYDNRRFCKSLYRYTGVRATIERYTDTPPSKEACGLFYSGAVLGTHCAISTVPESEQETVLNRTVDTTITGPNNPMLTPEELFAATVVAYDESFKQTDGLLTRLTADRAQMLARASELAGGDCIAREQAYFMRGFIFAAENALRILNEGVDAG